MLWRALTVSDWHGRILSITMSACLLGLVATGLTKLIPFLSFDDCSFNYGEKASALRKIDPDRCVTTSARVRCVDGCAAVWLRQ